MVDTYTGVGGKFRTKQGFLPDGGVPWSESGTVFTRVNTVDKATGPTSWRERIANRQPASTLLAGKRFGSEGTSMSYGYVEHVNGTPSPSSRFLRGEGEFWTNFNHPTTPSQLSITTADNAAKRKIVSRIKATQRSMQGLVFIGEIREAIAMVRNPFKLLKGDVFKFLRRPMRRSRGESPTKFHKRVADAWLETSFGWQPTLHDLDDGLKAIQTLSQQRSPSVAVSARGEDSRISAQQTHGSVPLGCTGTVSEWQTDEVKVRYHGICDVAPPTWVDGLHQFGISFSDILPAMWELIPYSFLADYFTNIGDIVEAASLNRSNLCWLERGTMALVTVHRTVSASVSTAASFPYVRTVTGNNCSGQYKSWCKTVGRSDFTALSLVPSLQFEIPGLGSKKWLNMAALATTHNQRRRAAYR